MIRIDGYEWDVPCDIERTAEVTPSEISGMLLDKTYFNDVIGTFMSYDVTLAVPPSMESEYASLYEMLTAPVDAHRFVMPYNQTTIEITARVESVQDVLVYTVSRKQYWKGVKFTAIANHPTKTDELGNAIGRGVSQPPDYMQLPVGTVYTVTEDGWTLDTFGDADERYYPQTGVPFVAPRDVDEVPY